MIALIARTALTHDGRRVKVGEVFEAAPVPAVVLLNRGQAVFAPRGSRPTSSPARVAPEAPVDPRQEAAAEFDEAEPDPPKTKRRRYQRRDLEAED